MSANFNYVQSSKPIGHQNLFLIIHLDISSSLDLAKIWRSFVRFTRIRLLTSYSCTIIEFVLGGIRYSRGVDFSMPQLKNQISPLMISVIRILPTRKIFFFLFFLLFNVYLQPVGL